MIEKYSIDVLAPKLPKWKKSIANFFLFNLPFLHIRPVNKLIKDYGHMEGGDFIQACTKDIGFEYELHHADQIPATGPVTLVSNHPGGADILATIAGLWNIRHDFKILANALICVKQVLKIVIPVDLMKKKDKIDQSLIHKAYQNNELVVFFAAGMNSRYDENGTLIDRRWRSTFLDYAYKYKTPIIVCNIDTKNTPLFYKVSKFRENSKYFNKLPLENMFQLREIFKQSGRKVNIYASKTLNFEEWSKYYEENNLKKNRALADVLHTHAYELGEQEKNIRWPKI